MAAKTYTLSTMYKNVCYLKNSIKTRIRKEKMWLKRILKEKLNNKIQ